jgi:hypothetical protein
MSSYRQILYHLVFRTKDSRKSIVQAHSRELYAYMMGIIRNKNSHSAVQPFQGCEQEDIIITMSIAHGYSDYALSEQ